MAAVADLHTDILMPCSRQELSRQHNMGCDVGGVIAGDSQHDV